MSKDGTISNDQETHAAIESEDDRVGAVLQLVPAHDAPRTEKNELKIKRGPGRPRKVERAPTTSDLEYNALMAEQRQSFIASDPLVRTIDGKGDSLEILYHIKREVAREAASLHFERIETEKRGRDTGQVSSRRIEALKKIADIELKIKEIDSESINMSSERMQKVFALWVETMREIAQETLPQEVLDLFFNRFASAMEGWEERAASNLR
jgi:hypothetical protein